MIAGVGSAMPLMTRSASKEPVSGPAKVDIVRWCTKFPDDAGGRLATRSR